MSNRPPKAIRAYRFFAVSPAGEIHSKMGHLVWPSPRGKPGAWVQHHEDVTASRTVLGCLRNRQGDTLALVEARQIVDLQDDKFAARKMRIIRLYPQQHLASLATVAAIMSLPIFERRHPFDVRPRKAIECVIEWLRTGKRPTDTANAAFAATYAAYGAADAHASDAASAAAYAAFAASDAYAAYAAAYASDAAANATDAHPHAHAGLAFACDFEREATQLLQIPQANLASTLATLLASAPDVEPGRRPIGQGGAGGASSPTGQEKGVDTQPGVG